jgi:hypothetical protein
MSIAVIRRGGAHSTGINYQKRNNQRELDVHGQCECRRKDVLSIEGAKERHFFSQYPDPFTVRDKAGRTVWAVSYALAEDTFC